GLLLSVALTAQTGWVRARLLEPTTDAVMAYDAARERVVLFRRGDTWEWDGVGWAWRNSAAGPTARSAQALAYDAARQRVVLFGGYSNGYLGDTWEWDGVSWAQRSSSASPTP